jgi:hypothetical protein
MWIKQEQCNVDPLDRWLDVSVRIAKKFGIPTCPIFKLKPVDGIHGVQTPQGDMVVYAFDWKEGMQYWSTCEYDISADLDGQESKQIVVIDEDRPEEALTVYTNWRTQKIVRYIRRIFSVHKCKYVSVQDVREGLSSWKLTRRNSAPKSLDFFSCRMMLIPCVVHFGPSTVTMRRTLRGLNKGE